MMFLILTAITGAGVYSAAYMAGKMQGIDEVKRIKGHYIASAGLSYAKVILKDTTLVCPVTKHIKTDYPTLWADLGLKGSEDVEIVITDHAGGGYDVTSKYTY